MVELGDQVGAHGPVIRHDYVGQVGKRLTFRRTGILHASGELTPTLPTVDTDGPPEGRSGDWQPRWASLDLVLSGLQGAVSRDRHLE
jgi:hypothetical protein